MKKYAKLLTLALAAVLTLTLLAACGMSNNPKKKQAALEEKGYEVEAVIGDNDLEAQAELDSMSDEMSLTAGELVALIAATKSNETDDVTDFIYIYFFKDGDVANRFWNSNQEQLDDLKDEYKDTADFRLKKEGSMVYFGTAQAIEDAR